jgi:hypothetical protein
VWFTYPYESGTVRCEPDFYDQSNSLHVSDLRGPPGFGTWSGFCAACPFSFQRPSAQLLRGILNRCVLYVF